VYLDKTGNAYAHGDFSSGQCKISVKGQGSYTDIYAGFDHTVCIYKGNKVVYSGSEDSIDISLKEIPKNLTGKILQVALG